MFESSIRGTVPGGLALVFFGFSMAAAARYAIWWLVVVAGVLMFAGFLLVILTVGPTRFPRWWGPKWLRHARERQGGMGEGSAAGSHAAQNPVVGQGPVPRSVPAEASAAERDHPAAPSLTGRVLAKKAANAWVKASTSPLEVLPPIAHAADQVRRGDTGLWVGGHAVLTDRVLGFSPNSLNRAVNRGALDVVIGLDQITKVDVVPAFGTNIVEVTWSGGVFQLRCYGAKKLASAIRAAAT